MYKLEENFGGKWKSPRKGNKKKLGENEETPSKIAATETDSESEDFLSNTVNSDMSSGEEDPQINILQFFLHKQSKRPAALLTHPHALLHLHLIKKP